MHELTRPSDKMNLDEPLDLGESAMRLRLGTHQSGENALVDEQ